MFTSESIKTGVSILWCLLRLDAEFEKKLLVGETSQGRGSDEREEALIHLIAISKNNAH